MKWLLGDGDVWLLAMLIAAGVLPGASDVVRGRAWGAEATLGGLVAVSGAVGLFRRVALHVRAAALLRKL